MDLRSFLKGERAGATMKGPNYILFKIISKITGFTENPSACCGFLNSTRLFTAEKGMNLKKK